MLRNLRCADIAEQARGFLSGFEGLGGRYIEPLSLGKAAWETTLLAVSK